MTYLIIAYYELALWDMFCHPMLLGPDYIMEMFKILLLSGCTYFSDATILSRNHSWKGIWVASGVCCQIVASITNKPEYSL